MKTPSKHFRFPISDFRFPTGKSAARFSKIGNRQSAIANARSAFTMIEIALCLAIIGFALVAIIGVLPAGLNVQKDNREETIINQDAVSWMNTLRTGARGYDDLTNYVIGITNYWARFEVVFDPTTSTYRTNLAAANAGPGVDGYSGTGSKVTSVAGTSDDVMTLSNGTRIVGLLSTPKYFPPPPPPGFGGSFQSNYVVAYVRAFSGSAVEKAPQSNLTIREGAFTYKLIAENISYVPVDPGLIDLAPAATNGMSAVQLVERLNRAHAMQVLQTNSHDLRLTFRWPQLPNGDIGNGRVTFRAFTGGWLLPTKDFYVVPIVPDQPLFFFQSSTYVK